MDTRLLFVYNADTGFFNLAADIAHKIFSPRTYACSLCGLTYGVFKIRPEWEDFVQNAPLPCDFLHRDEFQLAFPQQRAVALPAVFLTRSDRQDVLFSAAELSAFQSISALKGAILQRLQAHPSTLT